MFGMQDEPEKRGEAGQNWDRSHLDRVQETLRRPPYTDALQLIMQRDSNFKLGQAYLLLAVMLVHPEPRGYHDLGRLVMGNADIKKLDNWSRPKLGKLREAKTPCIAEVDGKFFLTDECRGRYPEYPASAAPAAADTASAAPAPEGPTVPAAAAATEAGTAQGEATQASRPGGGQASAGDDAKPTFGDTRSFARASGAVDFFGRQVYRRNVRRACEIRREAISDAALKSNFPGMHRHMNEKGGDGWKKSVYEKAFEAARNGALTDEDAATLDRFEAEAPNDDMIENLNRRGARPDDIRLDLASTPPRVDAPASPAPMEALPPASATTAPVAEAPAPASPTHDTPPPRAATQRRPSRMMHLPAPPEDDADGRSDGPRHGASADVGTAAPALAASVGDGSGMARTDQTRSDDMDADTTRPAEAGSELTIEGLSIDGLGYSPDPALWRQAMDQAAPVLESLEGITKSRETERLAALVKWIVERKVPAMLARGLTPQDVEAELRKRGLA